MSVALHTPMSLQVLSNVHYAFVCMLVCRILDTHCQSHCYAVRCVWRKKIKTSGMMVPTKASREVEVPVLVQRCRLGSEALRQTYRCTSAITPNQKQLALPFRRTPSASHS